MSYGFLYASASASAERNRLAKIENKVDNITTSQAFLLSIPLQQNWQRTPLILIV